MNKLASLPQSSHSFGYSRIPSFRHSLSSSRIPTIPHFTFISALPHSHTPALRHRPLCLCFRK